MLQHAENIISQLQIFSRSPPHCLTTLVLHVEAIVFTRTQHTFGPASMFLLICLVLLSCLISGSLAVPVSLVEIE